MVLILLQIIILSALPFFELRGGIPYGLLQKQNPLTVFLLAVSSNLLVAPAGFFFLDSVHPLLNKNRFYKRLFEKIAESKKKKASKHIEKYGWMGLALFTAIPLPLTGAYSSTLAAWVLGIERKKAVIAISSGVVVAGILITFIMLTGLEGWFLIKNQLTE